MKRPCELTRALLVVAGLSFAVPVFAQDVLVKIERLRPQELKMAGFELTSKQDVSVEAVGIRHRSRRKDARLSSAWILDARSREVVWELREAGEERTSDYLREHGVRIRPVSA